MNLYLCLKDMETTENIEKVLYKDNMIRGTGAGAPKQI